jgi:hypothetical protein
MLASITQRRRTYMTSSKLSLDELMQVGGGDRGQSTAGMHADLRLVKVEWLGPSTVLSYLDNSVCTLTHCACVCALYLQLSPKLSSKSEDWVMRHPMHAGEIR